MGKKEKNKEIIKLKSISKNIIFIAFIILVLHFIGIGINYYNDYIQYNEIGEQYVSILNTNLIMELKFMAGVSGIVFLLVVILNSFIIRNLKKFKEDYPILNKVKLPRFSSALFIAIVSACILSKPLATNALTLMNSSAFNVNDPLFYKDIAYYVFMMPFYQTLIDSLLGLSFGLTLYTVIYYISVFGFLFNEVEIEKVHKNGIFKHIITMFFIFGILQLPNLLFGAYILLFGEHALFTGPRYTDAYIWLNWHRISPVFLAVILIITYIFMIKNKYKQAIITMGTFAGFWIIGGVVAVFTNVFVVNPSEVEKESRFIANNINYTRMAYNVSNNLDYNIPVNIQSRTFYAMGSLTQEMLNINSDVLNNTQIIDNSSTTQMNKQMQTLNPIYDFNNVDVGFYEINGEKAITYISARELNKAIENNDGYDTKFKYTHGYGAVMSYTGKVDENSEPVYILKDIPLNSNVVNVSQPGIYFGENTENNVVVNSNARETEYVINSINEEATYTGTAGVQASFINRVFTSFNTGDFSLLFNSNIKNDSKILINRNVIERAEKVFPFLYIDDNPSLIVTDEGSLLWSVDGYTLTDKFPCSQYTKMKLRKNEKRNLKINYIRNSVKILIDAYDGTLKAYVVDSSDPIIQTYQKIYPGIFEAEMPNEIQNKTTYPEYLFKIQAEILEKYHNRDVDDFIKGENTWTIAKQRIDTELKNVSVNYTIKTFPDSAKKELVMYIPYTLSGKSYLSGILYARTDKASYGKLVLYDFPQTLNLLGPMQVDALVSQDLDIASELEEYNKTETKIRKGDMAIFPIETSSQGTVLYVEPLYILSDARGSTVKKLEKVIVSCQGKVAMGNSIEEALQKMLVLIKEDTSTITTDVSIVKDELVDKALQTYLQAKWYLTYSDWENYGIKMKEFDELVEQIINDEDIDYSIKEGLEQAKEEE